MDDSYLKQLRNKRKLTQETLSKHLGISYSHYSKIEGGFVKPSFELIVKIKNFYGGDFDANELFK